MVDVTRTFTVDKPAATVIAYLQDFGNAEQWDPGTQSCTRIDAGPVAVGAEWKNVSKVLGLTTELLYRLERLDPDHLTFVGRNDTATSTDDIAVRDVGSGSELTYHAHIDFHGAAKLAGPLMKLEFERLGTATRKQLTKAIAEL